MKNRKHEFEQIEQTTHTTKPVLTGFLVGGVIGAATALLFAPCSGKRHALKSGARQLSFATARQRP